MERERITGWLQRYVNAWETNDPEDVGALFTDDARYYTAPYREPWPGRQAIVEGWLDRKDPPGTWEFNQEVLGTDGDVAFVRGWTEYADGESYSNLWVIRLDEEGRCSEFIEWWMQEENGAPSP